MNNASFYIKVWVPKPDVNCKNHFVSMDEFFFYFQHCFIDLDENTPYHDYPNTFYRIYHYQFCDGIFFLWIPIGTSSYQFQAKKV